MRETYFQEMKRYVDFGPADEAALQALLPHAAPHFRAIAEEFYVRLHKHEEALQVFSGAEQIERLKGTLCTWMTLLLSGPWDESYYERRTRIGKMHVKIGLPQRYMFSAMNGIRISLVALAQSAFASDPTMRISVDIALAKIIDLELCIMLETYREAFIEKVQHFERLEKSFLQRRLAISEAQYQEIVETAEALITTFDSGGAVLLFNRKCEEITGLERTKVVGLSWLDIFVAEEQRQSVHQLFEDALKGERITPFEALISSSPGMERRVRWHLTTLPSVNGPILCAIGLDITDEYELALRKRRSDRLAAMGTMAAGLAHEIRNPLNAAHLQLALVQRRLTRPKGIDVQGALNAAQIVSDEMKRLAVLVDEFLQFARPQPLRLARADLRSTLEAMVMLIAPEAATAGVEVALLPGDKMLATVDDERIKQVVLNLLRNAIEATGQGGHVKICLEKANGTVVMKVEDDGPGFSPDAPIFEPFFTSKESGTGLGLTIVHRIVSDHGGKIHVESQCGRTVFAVALPESR